MQHNTDKTPLLPCSTPSSPTPLFSNQNDLGVQMIQTVALNAKANHNYAMSRLSNKLLMFSGAADGLTIEQFIDRCEAYFMSAHTDVEHINGLLSRISDCSDMGSLTRNVWQGSYENLKTFLITTFTGKVKTCDVTRWTSVRRFSTQNF